jgi:hypothetical protein
MMFAIFGILIFNVSQFFLFFFFPSYNGDDWA